MRRPRFDAPQVLPPPPSGRRSGPSPGLRDTAAVAGLLLESFRRGLGSFVPHARFEPVGPGTTPLGPSPAAPVFRLRDDPEEDAVELFGTRYRIGPEDGRPLTPQQRRMVRAIGAVLSLRFQCLFEIASPARLELYQGGNDDHHIAAYVEPAAYVLHGGRPSRIAATIQTLRTAALSTYENRRISTGALLLGEGPDGDRRLPPTPPDALPYGVELTGLKSLHRLCDGKRTLFLVDPAGKLAGIVDVARFAAEVAGSELPEVPCARSYQPHAQATRQGGHVCLVLSPNQEIKLFAEGAQAFAFAHGRWRMLDVAAKFGVWHQALVSFGLARALFQAALNLAEARHGALFVVVNDPAVAAARLIAPHDLLESALPTRPPTPTELTPGDPLAKRALHYLARGRHAAELDPTVLEALASLDGAVAMDHDGRLLAFGAILRHETSELTPLTAAEGARTTAALVASRFGPVLKVSEDGVVSCFLDGTRVWDL